MALDPIINSSTSANLDIVETSTTNTNNDTSFESLIKSLNQHELTKPEDEALLKYIQATSELLNKYAKPGHPERIRCLYMLMEIAEEYIYSHQYIYGAMENRQYFIKMSDNIIKYLKEAVEQKESVAFISSEDFQKKIEQNDTAFFNSSVYQKFLGYQLETSEFTTKLKRLEESVLFNSETQLAKDQYNLIDLVNRMIIHRISLNNDLGRQVTPQDWRRCIDDYTLNIEQHLNGTYIDKEAVDEWAAARTRLTSDGTNLYFSDFYNLLSFLRPNNTTAVINLSDKDSTEENIIKTGDKSLVISMDTSSSNATNIESENKKDAIYRPSKKSAIASSVMMGVVFGMVAGLVLEHSLSSALLPNIVQLTLIAAAIAAVVGAATYAYLRSPACTGSSWLPLSSAGKNTNANLDQKNSSFINTIRNLNALGH